MSGGGVRRVAHAPDHANLLGFGFGDGGGASAPSPAPAPAPAPAAASGSPEKARVFIRIHAALRVRSRREVARASRNIFRCEGVEIGWGEGVRRRRAKVGRSSVKRSGALTPGQKRP